MICAAPCFKNARASPGCMINHRIAHPASALLVFIQQLAHLLDRERRILSVERFVPLTLVEKRPVPCVRANGNFAIRLRSIAGAARSLICVGRSRTFHCLLRRSFERAASAVERLRTKWVCGELSGCRKTLGIRLPLDVKRSDSCPFIYRGTVC